MGREACNEARSRRFISSALSPGGAADVTGPGGWTATGEAGDDGGTGGRRDDLRLHVAAHLGRRDGPLRAESRLRLGRSNIAQDALPGPADIVLGWRAAVRPGDPVRHHVRDEQRPGALLRSIQRRSRSTLGGRMTLVAWRLGVLIGGVALLVVKAFA